MQSLDAVHAIIAIATSLLMLIVVWWKVSKDNASNRKMIEAHDNAIVLLQANKTENSVTVKLLAAVEKIESDLIAHHADFNIHRTIDSERRITELVQAVYDLGKENRQDHQMILSKLSRVERAERGNPE